MKNLLTVFLFIATLWEIKAQQPLATTSKISRIIVFQNQAQIQASIAVNLPSGRSEITIEEIASTIDPNTIQLKGTGDFIILGTKYGRSLSSSRKTKITEELKIILEQIDEVTMLIDVAKSESRMIEKNAEDIKSDTDGLFPTEFKEMIEFTRKQLIEVGKRELGFKRELKELTEKKNRLEQEIATIGGNQQLGELVVSVSTQKATTAKLNLNYIVNNAGWSPTYDIRSEGISDNVRLNYRANVYQRTGIDWENVKLSLSTSNPRMNQTKPELYPHFLNVYVPQPIMQRNLKMSAAAPMMADAAEGEAMSLNEVITVSESTLSVNFDVDIPYSIPSTGNPELVDVQTFNLPAEYNFFAVPKYSTNAFLVAKIKEWEKLNLLPGQANIYFEGAYIGKTYLNGSNTTDELKVSLGAATKVIVERKELTNFKTKRVIGGNIREEFVFETTIRNTTNKTVTLKVEEQIPVSQDSRISVDFDIPNGTEFEALTGKLTYQITLQPEQSIKKQIKYEVKYPKELQINNL